jgi:hypothetical protein
MHKNIIVKRERKPASRELQPSPNGMALDPELCTLCLPGSSPKTSISNSLNSLPAVIWHPGELFSSFQAVNPSGRRWQSTTGTGPILLVYEQEYIFV